MSCTHLRKGCSHMLVFMHIAYMYAHDANVFSNTSCVHSPTYACIRTRHLYLIRTRDDHDDARIRCECAHLRGAYARPVTDCVTNNDNQILGLVYWRTGASLGLIVSKRNIHSWHWCTITTRSKRGISFCSDANSREFRILYKFCVFMECTHFCSDLVF